MSREFDLEYDLNNQNKSKTKDIKILPKIFNDNINFCKKKFVLRPYIKLTNAIINDLYIKLTKDNYENIK